MFGMGGMGGGMGGGMFGGGGQSTSRRMIRMGLLLALLIVGAFLPHGSSSYNDLRLVYVVVIFGLMFTSFGRGFRGIGTIRQPSIYSRRGSAPTDQRPQSLGAPGWVPEGTDPTYERYWDGSQWTRRRHWDGTSWVDIS